MGPDELPRMILLETFEDREAKARGRPKNCWVRSIKRDLKSRGIESSMENLCELAKDREKWRKEVVNLNPIEEVTPSDEDDTIENETLEILLKKLDAHTTRVTIEEKAELSENDLIDRALAKIKRAEEPSNNKEQSREDGLDDETLSSLLEQLKHVRNKTSTLDDEMIDDESTEIILRKLEEIDIRHMSLCAPAPKPTREEESG
jgi:hypothetical protein